MEHGVIVVDSDHFGASSKVAGWDGQESVGTEYKFLEEGGGNFAASIYTFAQECMY
jgi:hypothetical protein